MKLFTKMRDGGPESPVIGYFLVEIKSLFSVVFLHFGGTREDYHSHAFNAVTIWLTGLVFELIRATDGTYTCLPWQAGQVKYTRRGTMHKVVPQQNAWALSFRGPWAKTWQEYRPAEDRIVTLAHGRKVVS